MLQISLRYAVEDADGNAATGVQTIFVAGGEEVVAPPPAVTPPSIYAPADYTMNMGENFTLPVVSACDYSLQWLQHTQ
jgi:hypothetical protein